MEPQSTKTERPATRSTDANFAGLWQGSLKPSSILELRLVLKLTVDGGGSLSGVLDSIDQDARDIPISKASEAGRVLNLYFESIRATYQGRLSDDGEAMSGPWQQGGCSTTLTFKRVETAPERRRPQEPARPYSYLEEPVVFKNAKAGLQLAGTLTLPGPGRRFAAAILVSGSGPQDRAISRPGRPPHGSRHRCFALR
jgi:uncharacterized protein